MPAEQAQRSEEPTPRRKQKARQEGQVASSREFTAAVQFTVAVLLLAAYSDLVLTAFERSLRGLLQEAFRASITVARIHATAAALLREPLSFVVVFWGGLVLLGVLAHMGQTGFVFAPKRLQPDFKRLSPLAKLRELPGDNLVQLLKALLMLPLAGWAFWVVVEDALAEFLRLPKISLSAGAALVGRSLSDLLLKAALVLLLLGLVDLYRQRRKMHKRLMMTKQEVKQEHKELEGNPQIKARLRRLQREFMRRRMMSQVPQSTLVVTNPSHYAVALRYEPATMAAPVVVAKGLDFLARRIRATAEQHGVPIVENPPLAQALYKSTEIGGEIPANLYHAVAEILAHIFRLTRGTP